MHDIVTIKGLKYGLQLTFAKGATFDDVQANLLDKLESGDGFFIRGTTVFVPKGYFAEDQNEKLRRMFHRHGMLFSTELKRPNLDPPSRDTNKPQKVKATPSTSAPVQNMMVINRTVRGGPEVKADSSVLICGNTAFVIADRLMPVQIRIADLVARAPDEPESVDKAERALIKDNMIIFEPVAR